jgi:hypothetical protein
MADGDTVPNEHHLARYCPPSMCRDGPPSGAAFELKIKKGVPEEYLSVNWLEILMQATPEAALALIRQNGYEYKADGRFAVGQAEEILAYVLAETKGVGLLSALHHPYVGNESHAGIHGFDMSAHGSLVAKLIADVMNERLYPGKV